MTYLIIAAAVVMIIGSISWILPTKTQRRQMDMRQSAICNGLSLQLKCELLPTALGLGYTESSYMTYRKPRPRPCEQLEIRQFFRFEDERSKVDGWSCPDALSADAWKTIEGHLLNLPKGVFLLEVAKSYVAVGWQEEGDVEDVERICSQLSSLVELGVTL